MNRKGVGKRLMIDCILIFWKIVTQSPKEIEQQLEKYVELEMEIATFSPDTIRKHLKELNKIKEDLNLILEDTTLEVKRKKLQSLLDVAEEQIGLYDQFLNNG